MPVRRLAVCSFPTPFDGEAAYFELGLHRLAHPSPPGWELVNVELEPRAGPDRQARAVEASQPGAIVMHVYRDRVRDALALASSLAALRPDVPLIWCGWTAHVGYLDAVTQAVGAPVHPRMILACGEAEAVIPPLLEMLAGGLEPASLVEASDSVAWFDPAARTWKGRGEFQVVSDLSSLPAAWSGPSPLSPHEGGAGWIEIARGCRYSCAFCIACAHTGKLRSHDPGRVAGEIAAAFSRGVRMFGLLASAINYDLDSLRAVSRAISALPSSSQPRVAGTVHAKFTDRERLELLSSMRWETMIVGLQSTTAEAQRLMRRREEQEAFASSIEKLGAMAVPEVELILGLPGDTAEGFRQSVQFALSLPVSLSVYRLRLDPWSAYLEQRHRLGIEADFARLGRVTSVPGFASEELESAEAWLRGLGKGAWSHRARRVLLDGEQIHPPRCGNGRR